MTKKRWVVESRLPAESAAALREYHPLVAQMLYNRKVGDGQAAALYFGAQLAQPEDPLRLTGMGVAVDRLRHAIRTGERIIVYGDYDTDGVTATALLVQVLTALGAAVHR